MSAFWCPKCGANLYGSDADSVADAHKDYCKKDKYDEMLESEFDPEWELIKGDEHRLTKAEEISVMRIARQYGWNQFRIRIDKTGVYVKG